MTDQDRLKTAGWKLIRNSKAGMIRRKTWMDPFDHALYPQWLAMDWLKRRELVAKTIEKKAAK